MGKKTVKILQDVLRRVFIFLGTIAIYVLILGVGLFLAYTALMKIGSVVNDTSMLEEARVTNIYDSIRRHSRQEDKVLAKEIYELRIENGYYQNNK